MIIGEPTPEFEHYFDRMLQLQQTAFDAIRPGRTLAEAETEVSAAYADLGVAGDAAPPHRPRHRAGGARVAVHRQGQRRRHRGEHGPHRRARDLRLRSGGFRHSDTVVVRADGVERLTYYPRDLESMIVEP